jgi:hypothetical protein
VFFGPYLFAVVGVIWLALVRCHMLIECQGGERSSQAKSLAKLVANKQLYYLSPETPVGTNPGTLSLRKALPMHEHSTCHSLWPSHTSADHLNVLQTRGEHLGTTVVSSAV